MAPPLASLLRPIPLFLLATVLRVVLLLYGVYQDSHSALKYTDLDYYVFTDAARYAYHSHSPYARETYRYTPLLAWLLVPTAFPIAGFFSFGKVLFAGADLLAGWLILRLLRDGAVSRSSSSSSSSIKPGSAGAAYMTQIQAGGYASLWLLNPMVATISTRGSSEGLLGVLTMALLWAVKGRRVGLAGLILGLSVHFKIYPFIYAPAILWWMNEEHMGKGSGNEKTLAQKMKGFISRDRAKFAIVSFSTFMCLNLVMYAYYGYDFLTHTYFHHFTRIDHRHNFSPYNILLYLTSSLPDPSSTSLHAESLAFVPQLLLSCVLIPLVLAKKDLATSMMAQTFAFVTFNKVCTSQYFLWYLVFLPLYLPISSFVLKPRLGITALVLWISGQAAWLYQGYNLEFLGESTFFPGMWAASLCFFLINCWILGIIISDGHAIRSAQAAKVHVE